MKPSMQINLQNRRGDHTISIRRSDHGVARWLVSVTPDSPMIYGYEGASMALDDQSIKRLIHWLTTGEETVADADLADLPDAWR